MSASPQACSVDGPLTCCGPPRDASNRATWLRIGLGTVIAAQSMAVDLAFNTSEASPRARTVAHLVVLAATVGTLALLGWPLLRAAAAELRRRRLTLEAMFLTGIVGAFTASVLATVTGEGAVYFEIVSILLVVYSLGQQISRVARDRAIRAAEAWAPALMTCDVVGEDGAVTTVPASEVDEGAAVLVHPGRTIPVDGVVTDGVGFVRESEMTGELFAAVRRPGDHVFAGTHSVDATLTVRVTAAGGDRRIDHIVAAVEQARSAPTSLQRQADRFIGWLLPLVVAVAAATFVGWTAVGPWETALFNAMAVLLVACPCALGLATPLALWVAVGRLGSRGLVVRHGDAVETLAAVDTAVFDKTGTLTETTPGLVDLVVEPPDGLGKADVKAMLDAVERASGHPIGEAFQGLGGKATRTIAVERVQVLPGVGVAATVRMMTGARHDVAVGNRRLLEWDQAPAWNALRDRLRGRGHVLAAVVDGRVAAAAVVEEQLRSSWTDALAALRGELAVTPVLMTGDVEERAAGLGVEEVHARQGPADKFRHVRRLQRAGRRVLFVGDGVNDSAAMAAADVSVAVAGGADLAAEVGDVVWHGSDLETIPWAIGVARDSIRTVRTNMAFAAVYNLSGVALAAAGVLHPVVAAILMTCSSLIVTWRAAGREWEEAAPPDDASAPAGAPAMMEAAR